MFVYSAIIVSFKPGEILESCLRSLLDEASVAEVILVVNGETAKEKEILARFGKYGDRLKTIFPPNNIGFAAGCNLGAQYATGSHLAFVNPDLIMPEGTLEKISEAFVAHPYAWICGARILNPDGTEQRGGRRGVLTPWRSFVEVTRLWSLFPNHPHFSSFNSHRAEAPLKSIEVPTVSGAFMVIPKERWRQLEGMDERYFLHVEDIDICLRVIKAGGQVLYAGDAPVYHHQGSSNASLTGVEWHKTRSLCRYFSKHFSDTYPKWGLRLIDIVLWLRFVIIAPVLSGKDCLKKLGVAGIRKTSR